MPAKSEAGYPKARLPKSAPRPPKSEPGYPKARQSLPVVPRPSLGEATRHRARPRPQALVRRGVGDGVPGTALAPVRAQVRAKLPGSRPAPDEQPTNPTNSSN